MKQLRIAIIVAVTALLPAGLRAQNAGAAANQGAGQAGVPSGTVLRITEPRPGEQLRQSFVNVQFELTNSGASASGVPNFEVKLDSQDPVITGVRMTLEMLRSALKKFGVTPVDAEPGTPFDPAMHQAMQQVDGGDQPANTIVDIYQKGYLLNERLLRPAMVTVAK